jgi:hypothetical protein
MRALAEMTADEQQEARDAADTLVSERLRSYLPGHMLSMLLGKFRDDLADAMGMERPSPARRVRGVQAAKLDDLTSRELDAVSGAVLALVKRFTAFMDDPALPELLRDFRDVLLIEQADRARIAEEITEKATAS